MYDARQRIMEALSLLGGMFAYRMVNPAFRSRNAVERIVMTILAASSAIAILTTIGIVFSVIFESMRFFALVPVSEFLFGTTWNPQFEGAERAVEVAGEHDRHAERRDRIVEPRRVGRVAARDEAEGGGAHHSPARELSKQVQIQDGNRFFLMLMEL